MPEIMAEVWLCPGWPSETAGFNRVRMILEVSPALNVRMSIRLAGPHFETTHNQDHAAAIPSRVKAPTLTQRDLFTEPIAILRDFTVAAVEIRDGDRINGRHAPNLQHHGRYSVS